EGWHGGRRQTVRFIDFDDVDNNDFRLVRQFTVDGPGAVGSDRIVPDLVLFVNGIPLVVIEAKSPDANAPMAGAIDQLRRYANQRIEVQASEGNNGSSTPTSSSWPPVVPMPAPPGSPPVPSTSPNGRPLSPTPPSRSPTSSGSAAPIR